jgi:hypothetical protein
MKNVCLFLCLLALNVYGQSAHIKEIKDKPSDRFFHTGDSTIVYPLIVTKNPAADKLMNAVKSRLSGLGSGKRPGARVVTIESNPAGAFFMVF